MSSMQTLNISNIEKYLKHVNRIANENVSDSNPIWSPFANISDDVIQNTRCKLCKTKHKAPFILA